MCIMLISICCGISTCSVRKLFFLLVAFKLFPKATRKQKIYFNGAFLTTTTLKVHITVTRWKILLSSSECCVISQRLRYLNCWIKSQNKAIQLNSLTQVLCELITWEVSAHLHLSYSHSVQKEESISLTVNTVKILSPLLVEVSL